MPPQGQELGRGGKGVGRGDELIAEITGALAPRIEPQPVVFDIEQDTVEQFGVPTSECRDRVVVPPPPLVAVGHAMHEQQSDLERQGCASGRFQLGELRVRNAVVGVPADLFERPREIRVPRVFVGGGLQPRQPIDRDISHALNVANRSPFDAPAQVTEVHSRHGRIRLR